MKVFFVNNGTTHYYNLVLNKLNQVKDLELTVIVPNQVSSHVGAGVYQTREGASFRVIELPEYNLLGRYPSFRGLAELLRREKPDVVITADTYIFTFLFNLPVVLIRKTLGIKLIMKSIPFRLPDYQTAKQQLGNDTKGLKALPRWMNALLAQVGILNLLRALDLQLRKWAYNIPDAHVNYVDAAFEIYGSYGVERRKIFVTRNSPDTDLLFDVRASIETAGRFLPDCKHRLIHVGRLVEWKRVDMLLRAFARIKKRFSDSELLIIGTGPEEKTLKALSQELQVSQCVTFLGGIYDSHLLAKYLMASSIYVLSGMGGISINEAMCFGLPILCSVGDGTEKMLVRDDYNGKYFRDGDEDDLVAKIDYLFQRPELMETMGARSTQIIRDEINVHTVIDGYRQALSYVCAR